MTARIAITGGFGLLGGRLALHLGGAGRAVRLIVHDVVRPRPWAAPFETVVADVTDAGALADAVAGADTVVHLAALNAQACAADPAAAARVNVGGTANLVAAARSAGVRRVLYVSTVHVYGAPLAGDLDEDSPTVNTHPYAATHRRAETLVRGAEGMEGIVIRLSNGYGAPADAGADCWMLVANDLCRQAALAGALALRGTGMDQRDFLPVADVAGAITHLLRLDGAHCAGGLFNVAAGRSTTVLALAERIAARAGALFGATPPITRAPGGDGSDPAVRIATARLAATGFMPAVDHDAEIDATLRFCRTHFEHA